ncbi:hypothetical protein [Phyllobacterium pellucidum]|uniref:hypothetical protein n=1 Tax=Phyllobacterium pellucidum TaxID=2740464 RepID=UPI001D159D05|nr:hypothetical protein [Phyllobacterium sp. T1018]UGY08577.1 hypothetical protein LLE51_011020 [Phyllobacterium sp. T1018]
MASHLERVVALGFPADWAQLSTFTAGQSSIMHYNRDLMMAILWDRMVYLTPLVNTEVIPLEQAIEAIAWSARRITPSAPR